LDQYTSFHAEVFLVLKQVHPEMGLSLAAAVNLDRLFNDTIRLLGSTALAITLRTGRYSVALGDMKAAVRTLLAGELVKHAMGEGNKAVTKFAQ